MNVIVGIRAEVQNPANPCHYHSSGSRLITLGSARSTLRDLGRSLLGRWQTPMMSFIGTKLLQKGQVRYHPAAAPNLALYSKYWSWDWKCAWRLASLCMDKGLSLRAETWLHLHGAEVPWPAMNPNMANPSCISVLSRLHLFLRRDCLGWELRERYTNAAQDSQAYCRCIKHYIFTVPEQTIWLLIPQTAKHFTNYALTLASRGALNNLFLLLNNGIGLPKVKCPTDLILNKAVCSVWLP